MSAILVSALLVSSFAVWVTVHAALAFGLIRRAELGWRWFWLLFVPAMWLAPYWGFKHGMVLRSSLWLVACGAYLSLLFAGLRFSP